MKYEQPSLTNVELAFELAAVEKPYHDARYTFRQEQRLPSGLDGQLLYEAQRAGRLALIEHGFPLAADEVLDGDLVSRFSKGREAFESLDKSRKEDIRRAFSSNETIAFDSYSRIAAAIITNATPTFTIPTVIASTRESRTRVVKFTQEAEKAELVARTNVQYRPGQAGGRPPVIYESTDLLYGLYCEKPGWQRAAKLEVLQRLFGVDEGGAIDFLIQRAVKDLHQ